MPDKDFLTEVFNWVVNYGDQKLREKYRKEFESDNRVIYQALGDVFAERCDFYLVSATEAFLELKAEDAKVFDLLSKYMGVKDIDILQEILNNAKVNRAFRSIIPLIEKEHPNWTKEDMKRYIKYDLGGYRKFEDDPKLLKLPPEKLKETLEKKLK